ncbi:MAG: amidohydrolase family protein [Pseudomonadota bacterium]
MPDFAIVDTHVHFYDHDHVPIPWTRGVAPLNRAFRPADHDADRAGVEVEAIVFVEVDVAPGLHLKEAEWVAGLAESDPRIQAIVAHVPLDRGEAVAPDLEALASQPLVRGIRRLIQDEADAPAFCAAPAFLDALRLLPAHGLHFEICIRHHQMRAAIDLVARLPEVSFVLDHIGKPGIAARVREPWWEEIAELAALPNVVCKLSGVATEAHHDAWQEADLRPYVDRVLELFGADRTMFGSDWPVMRLAIGYPRWVEIVDAASSTWSVADRRRLYVDNAKRVYRLR